MTDKTYKSSQGPAAAIFTAFAILTMGAVLLLNLQPWFALGKDFTAQIDTGPLLGLADRVIGGRVATLAGLLLCFVAIKSAKSKVRSAVLGLSGLILLLRPGTLIQALGELVGFLMWGWIQFVQVSPMLAQHSLIPASAKWINELKRYRVIAYAIELFACLVKYPPYADGDLSRMLSDLQSFTLNPSLWSWSNFFWAGATMMAVELVFKFLLKAGVYSGAFTKTEPKKTTQNNSSAWSKNSGPENYYKAYK